MEQDKICPIMSRPMAFERIDSVGNIRSCEDIYTVFCYKDKCAFWKGDDNDGYCMMCKEVGR